MNTYVPYEDFTKLSAEAQKLNDVKEILKADFNDAACQILAIKAVLGLIVDPSTDASDDTTPADPEPSEPSEDTEPTEDTTE